MAEILVDGYIYLPTSTPHMITIPTRYSSLSRAVAERHRALTATPHTHDMARDLRLDDVFINLPYLTHGGRHDDCEPEHTGARITL